MTTQTATQITEEKALEIANEIVRLEATVKAMKDQLKTYVEENGELITGDTVWGFQEATSWSFDPSSIKEFMKSIMIDGYTSNPYDLIAFSKPKLDKLGLNEAYLNQYAEKKITKRFTKRKK